MNDRRNKSPTATKSTDLDDWETDPDFVRDMDEMDQRWGGSKRTVGSINMNELIDEVRKDHKIMREKFDHPSQRDHSDGFGGKFGVQHDRKDQSAHGYDYLEKLSKHTSQEISRKVITSSSLLKGGEVSDAKRTFMEKTTADNKKETRSPPAAKPSTASDSLYSRTFKTASNLEGGNATKKPGERFEETSSTKRFIKEEKSSSAMGGGDLPPAFRSIQEKIDAFKKEFEDMENKVAKKTDLSKVIKKTTNVEKSSNVEYVTRSDANNKGVGGVPLTKSSASSSSRPTSTSPLSHRDLPKTSIKSLSEKFETLGRDDGEDFRRRTEVKRKEFFDQIKSQVRETRKELDGFDPIDEDIDEIERKFKERVSSPLPSAGPRFTSTSPSSRASSRLSNDSQQAAGRPKVYTRRETTQEEIVSKLVKENDKVIENETKRNVERSSSCHGSSDEEEGGQSKIRLIDQELRTSPVGQQTESPVDKLRREIPTVDPEVKGAGLMARTLYDYKAVESDELSFDVDDLITNIEKVDAGWYKGTISYKDGRKQVGLFPANYVRLLNDTSEY